MAEVPSAPLDIDLLQVELLCQNLSVLKAEGVWDGMGWDMAVVMLAAAPAMREECRSRGAWRAPGTSGRDAREVSHGSQRCRAACPCLSSHPAPRCSAFISLFSGQPHARDFHVMSRDEPRSLLTVGRARNLQTSLCLAFSDFGHRERVASSWRTGM